MSNSKSNSKSNSNMNKNLTLFTKYLKNNKNLLTLRGTPGVPPLKDSFYYVGKTKYLPPASKEWKNSFYAFNSNKLKNLPLYDLNVNSLIKNYFNLYFNNKFLFSRYKPHSFRNLSFNKIYVSKAEIKHTNNKALLTVYVYNREKISILTKIKGIKNSFYEDFLKEIWKELYIFFSIPLTPTPQKFFDFQSKLNFFYKNLLLLRKYKLRLNLNKYKFEEKLLFELNNLILKFYKKKVEFNIVNLKSIIFNSDLFTKILALHLKDRNSNVIQMMGVILKKAIFPQRNWIIKKRPNLQRVDFNLMENKFKSLNLTAILIDNNLSELLNNIYYNVLSSTITRTSTSSEFKAAAKAKAKPLYFNFNLKKNYDKIYDIIFNSINYKNLGGIKLEVKGRLTKRNRADRSLFKVKIKGGLKNIDSSYLGLSSVNYRGYVQPNVEYSVFTSKRRIGAFAVKGWISGKS